jgi:cytochrome c-type biogenesis protein
LSEVTIWIALWAGFASFISPCCLPLYPSYISYITGISVNKLQTDRSAKDVRWTTMTHTLFFIAGFSIIFYTLGFGAGLVADLFFDYQNLLRTIAGLLFMVMGLVLLGIFQPQILMREWKLPVRNKPAGYLGSLVLGIGFAAGWSPCIGPILSAILALSATEPGTWFSLMTAYTLGFAIPFFIMAFFLGSTRWILKYTPIIMKIGGAMMILIGVLLLTNKLAVIVLWLYGLTPDWLII